LEKELEKNDEVNDKKTTSKTAVNKTIINQDEKPIPNKHLKDIPKKVEAESNNQSKLHERV
jgi:hypothetical protein